MKLMSKIYSIFTTELTMFTEDTINIIINTLADNCPDIKKQVAIMALMPQIPKGLYRGAELLGLTF